MPGPFQPPPDLGSLVQPATPLPPPDFARPQAGEDPNVSGWAKFLEKLSQDTALQQGLLTAGASMLQPRTGGQSQAGAISQGLVAGSTATNAQRDRELSRDLRERQVGAAEVSAGASESQAATAAGRELRAGELQDSTVRAGEAAATTAEFANTPEERERQRRLQEAQIANLDERPLPSAEMQLVDRFIDMKKLTDGNNFNLAAATQEGLEFSKRSRAADTPLDAFNDTVRSLVAINPIAFAQEESRQGIFDLANLAAGMTAEARGLPFTPITPENAAAFTAGGPDAVAASEAQRKFDTWSTQGRITDEASRKRAIAALKRNFPELPEGWEPR